MNQQNLAAVCEALDTLKRFPKLLARLHHIVKHAETSEEGDAVFVSPADAGEVYTILHMAIAGGAERLGARVAQMRGGDRATTGTNLVQDAPDVEGATEPVELPGEVLIAANWT